MFKNSTSVIVAGFVLVLCLMVGITVVGLSRMAALKARTDVITNVHTVKTGVIAAMRRIVTARSLAMYTMLVQEDAFAADEEFMHFRRLGGEFIDLRRRLELLGLDAQEQAVLTQALAHIRVSAPLQEAIVEGIHDGERQRARRLISAHDVPLEKQILDVFDRLMEIERRNTRDALEATGREYRRAFNTMSVLDVATILLGAFVAVAVTRRTKAIERALFQEKEQAEVTLHGIGDAVVTTDPGGCVRYLNPAAEQLTRWSLDAARGRPLHEIYRVVEEGSRRSVLSPLELDGRAVRVEQHILLIDREGDEHAVEDSLAPLRNADGRPMGTVLVFRDVTKTRAMAQQLAWQANHDDLTGLANRRSFEAHLEAALAEVSREGTQHALLYLDLDQFKVVNDTCGHVAGDELLQHLAVVLREGIRESDTLARLGGDEFGVLLRGCAPARALEIAEHLRESLHDFRFVWKTKTFRIGASIGAVMLDARSGTLDRVLSAADAACFVAKDQGRNRVWLHQREDTEIRRRRGEMEIVHRLTAALEEGRFQLYRQAIRPVADPAHGGFHYELLVRMVAEDGLAAPMSFIPAAERYGMMPEIDRWVIRTAFHWLRNARLWFGRRDLLAINVSGQSIGDDAFLDFVISELEATGVDGAHICFEITETAAIANWHKAIRVVSVLKGLGCHFALDDFGSGMSSFSYLKNIPVDFIKIDGAFVREMHEDPVNYAMVEAIHQIGHVLGIKTVAEFVENDAILRCLRELGVDYAQGYGIHVPEPL